MSSGTKRPYDREEKGEDGKRSKPKDWRDAFLDEDEPRRRSDDDRHHSSRDRDHRSGSSRDTRDGDRARDRYGDRERERERGSGRDKERDHYREREKGDSARRYGDTRDQRRDYTHDRDHHTNDRHDSSARRQSVDREEGEIEPSPVKINAPLPATSSSSDQNPELKAAELAPPRGFQAVSVPTGPKSRVPQTRPAQSQEDTKEEEVEEKDPEVLLEERRRKRAGIMAKFQAQGRKENPVESVAASPAPDVGTGQDSFNSGGIRTGATSLLKQLGTRSTSLFPSSSDTPTGLQEPSLAPTPQGHDFDLTKSAGDGAENIPPAAQQDQVGADAMISAADYDPTQDMKNDRDKRIKDSEAAQVADGVGEPVIDVTQPEDEWEEVEIEVDDEDEEMDMFAAFDDEATTKKKKKVTVRRLKVGVNGVDGDRKQEIVKKSNTAAALQVVDNVDDTDGYYRITPGEILDDGRYQVTITLGKGMFSAVVKAKILKAVDRERRQDVVGKEVAIKIIRSQESMYVAGRKEAAILQKLNEADPEDKKHVVRMERTFEHRGHLCIVTESLSMNLRDVIKRFGKDVGLNMRAVRAYAHQMFLALSLLRKTNIVHADIKPDNILATENKATLKVCDLGSASDVKDGEITPYLVSRFYRAPEIILGLPYDTAIDVWSMGCTLYELYTGKILFPGKSNNHMLLLMMEVKGKLNHRMIKKATLGEMHFDEQLNFISIEQDKITRQDVAKVMNISKATRDIRSRLLPPSSIQLKMKEDELKQLQHFIDLLDKCLQLDPARRITPRDALLHPFLTG